MFQGLLRAIQERAGHAVMFRIFVFYLLQTALREFVDGGVRVGHDDRRVGGDDELRLPLDQLVHRRQEGELSLRGESRFRFVEQIEAVTAQPVDEQVGNPITRSIKSC